MLGARDALGALGYTVRAADSLGVFDVSGSIEQLRRDGLLVDVVVIHVGTDAELYPGPEGLDSLSDALEGVPHVFVLNVHADRPWADDANVMIDELVSRHPNITLIDWDGLAGNCPGQCFTEDAIHLLDDGRQYYGNIIDHLVAAATGRAPNTVPNTTTPAGAIELPTPPGIACVHTVVEGDNPTVIASRYLVTVDELAAVNAESPTWNQFLIGDAIYIPANGACPSTSASTNPPGEPGDVAVWALKPDEIPAPDAQSFTVLVTRLGCNGGVTGDVYPPTVSISDAEIVVTFTVEHSPGGRCPTNDQVPYVVDAGQPIGDRRLVDGACLPDDDGVSTSFCTDGGVRY